LKLGKEQPRLALILPTSLDVIGLVDRIIIELAIVSAATLLVNGCTSSQYMGISLIPGKAPTELQNLATRARAGDKQAQTDLGTRFEEGRGMPRNIGRATRLYRQAARASGGAVWIYSPPVNGKDTGQMIAIDRGVRRSGLKEAADNLQRLGR